MMTPLMDDVAAVGVRIRMESLLGFSSPPARGGVRAGFGVGE